MPAATQSSPPATARQIETIKRMAKQAGKEIETEGLTRAQGSELISSLIGELGEARGNSAANKVEEPAQPKRPPFLKVEPPKDEDTGDPFGEGGNPFDGADDDLGLRSGYDEMDDFEIRRTPDLREGQFPFVCTRVTRMPPGASGYPYGLVEWTCLAEGFKGATVNDNVSHSPNSAFRRDQLLDALVASGHLKEGETLKLYSGLPGKCAWIDVFLDTYEGRTSPKVKSYVVGPAISYEPPKTEQPVTAHLGEEFR